MYIGDLSELALQTGLLRKTHWIDAHVPQLLFQTGTIPNISLLSTSCMSRHNSQCVTHLEGHSVQARKCSTRSEREAAWMIPSTWRLVKLFFCDIWSVIFRSTGFLVQNIFAFVLLTVRIISSVAFLLSSDIKLLPVSDSAWMLNISADLSSPL